MSADKPYRQEESESNFIKDLLNEKPITIEQLSESELKNMLGL